MTKQVFYQKEDENIARITTIHNKPEILSKEEKSKGIEIADNAVPTKPALQNGQYRVLLMDLNTKELWYEIRERLLSPEEETNKEVKEMKSKIDSMEKNLNELKAKLL